jgi:hypothetical protein
MISKVLEHGKAVRSIAMIASGYNSREAAVEGRNIESSYESRIRNHKRIPTIGIKY